MDLKLIALSAALLALITGCGMESTATATPSPSAAPSSQSSSADERAEWTQTWSKDYQDTTCTEFLSDMSDREQVITSADLLIAQRNPSTTLTTTMIAEFASIVTRVCESVSGLGVIEAGQAAYSGDPTRWNA